MTSDGLLEMGADVLAVLERYIERSEQRRDYRQDHGRGLSKQHIVQLEEIRLRLDNIIAPAPDVAELKAEFDKLSEQLEAIDV